MSNEKQDTFLSEEDEFDYELDRDIDHDNTWATNVLTGTVPLWYLELLAEKHKAKESIALDMGKIRCLHAPHTIRNHPHLAPWFSYQLRGLRKEYHRISQWAQEAAAEHNEDLLRVLRAVLRDEESVIDRYEKYQKLCQQQGEYKDDVDLDRMREIPITEFLSSAKGRTSNRTFHLCPLHNETTPSLCVYTSQNSWWCYGCSTGGDVFDMVQQLHKVTFKESLSILKSHL